MEQVNNTTKSVQLIADFEELRKNLKDEINQFDNLLLRLFYCGNNDIYNCLSEAEEADAKALKERLVEIQEWARVWNVLSNGIRSVLSE